MTTESFTHLRRVDFAAQEANPGRFIQTLLDPLNSGLSTFEVNYIRTPANGGSREGLHYHDVDKAFYVVSGTMMVQIGDDTYTAEPGTLIVFPARVPHRNWNINSETVHLAIMAPAPEPNKPKGAQVNSLTRGMAMTDEDQIREMQALWGQRHADRDAAGWSELWTEDGKFINPRGGEVVGRAALQQYFTERYMASERRTTHVFGPSVIRIEGDTAQAATDYLSSSRDGDGATVAGAIGRVHVRLVKQGGKWLFSEYRIVNHPDALPSIDR